MSAEPIAVSAPQSVSPRALALLGAFVACAVGLVLLPQLQGPLTFAFVVTGWLVSVVVHEFAHAYVAWRAGDHTVVEKGYLTLDPFKYSDPATTLVIPILALVMGGIGFPGGAVYLRPDLMRSKVGRSLASLAGPGGTLLVLLALSLGLSLSWTPASYYDPLYTAAAMLAFLQATALLLNLLPVPGLDGYGVLRPFLPKALSGALQRYEKFAFLGLLLLIFVVPSGMDWLFNAAADLCGVLGIPLKAVAIGWESFEFWRP